MYMFKSLVCVVFLFLSCVKLSRSATRDNTNEVYEVTGEYQANAIGGCDERNPCKNSGTCYQSRCFCQPRTSGDFCQNVDCGDMCGNETNISCRFNIETKRRYCECNDLNERFDANNKQCQKCECGEGQISCKWSSGDKKICECEDGFAFDARDSANRCFNCKGWCNENARTCSISSRGTVSCVCKEGFQLEQNNYQCAPCDCGPHGNCSYRYSYYKECACEDGYKEDKSGICSECVCETAGSCYFDYYGKKRCSCPDGYKERTGDCGECDCGPGTFCYYNKDDKKICNCNKKQYEENGLCKDCDCDLDVDCAFSNGIKTCQCPDGFAQVFGECEDINECLDFRICPSTTYCVNTNGSYECACLKGYEKRHEDTKAYGCEDINECVVEYPVCLHENTWCMNTPGSYKCLCKGGYKEKEVFTIPKYNTCFWDQSSWRNATIFVGVALAILIVSLVIVILLRRRRIVSV